jgi:hypothetical protein
MGRRSRDLAEDVGAIAQTYDINIQDHVALCTLPHTQSMYPYVVGCNMSREIITEAGST